jgi:hypothetical protein
LKRPLQRELDRILKDEADIGGPLMEHLGAVRTSESDMRHLIARSAGVGLPSWVSDPSLDVADSCSAPQWSAEPYKRCIQVTATHPSTDRVSTRYVTTLILGQPPEMEVPDPDVPWLTLVDRLGFPVEMSARVSLLSGQQAAGEAAKKLKTIRDQQAAYAEHEMDEPLEFERQAKHAKQAEDRMRNAKDIMAARVHGWYRITVWGSTGEDALKRAKAVHKLFTDKQWKVYHPPIGQYRLTRELMPCEPLSTETHMRRMELVAFASGMPHVAAKVGDGRGPMLGTTVGAGQQVVCLDSHYATEVAERSGVILIAGENGSGKSALLAKMIDSAVRRGIRTIAQDPSGPMARLCTLFPTQSRHLSLDSAPAGTLSPWRLIPQPRRSAFAIDGRSVSDVDRLWEEAKVEAYSARIDAALDAALGTLPWSLADNRKTPSMLRKAVRAVGGAPGGSFHGVIENLRGMGDGHADDLADELEETSRTSRGALYLGTIDRDEITSAEEDFSSLLTVITFPGLEPPDPKTDRKHWLESERRSVVLSRLALLFTSRAIYTGSATERKLVSFDEVKLYAGDARARAFGTRIGMDARKRNACIPMATQVPKHHLEMGLEAVASTVLIGHLEHEDAAADACRLLHVPQGVGYEASFATLNPNAVRRAKPMAHRDFVMRDVYSNVEKIRVTLPPELHAAIDTTARSNGHRVLTQ